MSEAAAAREKLLALLAPAAAATGVELGAVAEAVDRVRPAWRAAHPSLLTPGGFPAEVTFSSEPGLRLTLEPAGAADPPAEKWRAAAAMLAPLRPPLWLGELARLPGQRFGCWLGLRFDDGGALRPKLYQEVVREGQEPVRERMREAGLAADAAGALAPLLVGWTAEGIEYYARFVPPSPRLLHALLSAAGLPLAQPWVAQLMTGLAGLAPDRLGELRLGVSLLLRRGGIDCLSLFVHGLHAGGDNRRIRARVNRLAREIGRGPRGYEAACEALSTDRSGAYRHGMIGLGLTRDGGLGCSSSLSPIW